MSRVETRPARGKHISFCVDCDKDRSVRQDRFNNKDPNTWRFVAHSKPSGEPCPSSTAVVHPNVVMDNPHTRS